MFEESDSADSLAPGIDSVAIRLSLMGLRPSRAYFVRCDGRLQIGIFLTAKEAQAVEVGVDRVTTHVHSGTVAGHLRH